MQLQWPLRLLHHEPGHPTVKKSNPGYLKVCLAEFLLSRKLVKYVHYENAELVLKFKKTTKQPNTTNGLIIVS